MSNKTNKVKMITDVLVKMDQTIVSIPLWKTKDVELSAENLQENIFILSTDLSLFLGIRHNNLKRNISKLQYENNLSEHLLTGEQMFEKGNTTQGFQQVYALKPLEIHCLLMDISSSDIREKKFVLFKNLQDIENLVLQHTGMEYVVEETEEDTSGLPLVKDILEPYLTTNEGIQLWKRKGVAITMDNVLDSVVILSSDLAAYFSVRHDNMVNQNILKLQKEKILPDHLLKIKEMVNIGSSAQRSRLIYGLTRHQTYHLTMDFAGSRARKKKHSIVSRLEAIEADVLKGAFESAREKALEWDGVLLLQQHGLRCSIPGNIATRKDIACFLQVPMTTLNTFLKRNDTIRPIPLDKDTIRLSNHKANRLFGYKTDDTLKIAFWMDSPKGAEIKRQLASRLGVGTLERMVQPKTETEWREALSKVFHGFGFKTNHPIGKYRVDFYVSQLALALECDGDAHKYYDAEEEEKREAEIVRRCALVRFQEQSAWEDVVNGILNAKPHKVIRVSCQNSPISKSNKR